jgi:hypothetical protein
MELKKLRPLVNQELWGMYESYLKEVIELKTKELINTTDEHKIRALQGQLRLLQELVVMREKANAS